MSHHSNGVAAAPPTWPGSLRSFKIVTLFTSLSKNFNFWNPQTCFVHINLGFSHINYCFKHWEKKWGFLEGAFHCSSVPSVYTLSQNTSISFFILQLCRIKMKFSWNTFCSIWTNWPIFFQPPRVRGSQDILDFAYLVPLHMLTTFLEPDKGGGWRVY